MNTNTNIPSPSNYTGKTIPSAAIADDFHKVVNEAETLVKAIGNESGAQMNQMRDRVSSAVKTARDTLMTWEKDMADMTKRAAASTDNYVHENPWKSVAISAAAGTAVGMLLGILLVLFPGGQNFITGLVTVPMLLVLMPVIFASFYASYRDIFGISEIV